ncbi:MAG: hypothetical protein E7607_03260 [Ruminococcaceae bacterium]|nr:hypothetical protein [Oscillospiraceae bacterium]
MAKNYSWEIEEQVLNIETEKEETVIHKVSLLCSNLSGKAIITIDGTEFDISTKPFGLKGTNQVFRLGEMAAIIDFPKKGEPDIVIDGRYVRSGNPYGA